ncbi:MAG: hypothetical protein Q8P24_03240, partial [Desulfobacterales bacterium]|nr:hypothetical protein [Desulfobacterales bacterium]
MQDKLALRTKLGDHQIHTNIFIFFYECAGRQNRRKNNEIKSDFRGPVNGGMQQVARQHLVKSKRNGDRHKNSSDSDFPSIPFLDKLFHLSIPYVWQAEEAPPLWTRAEKSGFSPWFIIETKGIITQLQ